LISLCWGWTGSAGSASAAAKNSRSTMVNPPLEESLSARQTKKPDLFRDRAFLLKMVWR
jgi:hypothetical protein